MQAESTVQRATIHEWDPDDDRWQESVAAWFHDREAGVGGFLRFGVHPVQGVGRANLFAFFEGSSRFCRVRTEVPVDLAVGGELRVGQNVADLDDAQRLRFRWSEPESEACLLLEESFYPEAGFHGVGDDALADLIYGGHLESSGWFAGSVRIGDEVRQVRALAHRDRSWGPRDMASVLTNRMMSGTFGPSLSFALNTIVLTNGTIANVGLVARNGIVEPTTDFTILPAIHLDGYSVDSGRVIARLNGGEELEISCSTIQGFLNPHDDYLCSEHISVARCGDLLGFCDNELTNNPRLGTATPTFLQYVTGKDGLSSFEVQR